MLGKQVFCLNADVHLDIYEILHPFKLGSKDKFFLIQTSPRDLKISRNDFRIQQGIDMGPILYF